MRSSSSRTGAAASPTCAPPQIELYDGLVARQPELLAVAALRLRRSSTTCCRASSRPASTTRPSCGRPALWMIYEHVIRRAAGLGRAPHGARSRPLRARPMPIATCWWSARARRLAAALAAGRAGARVILADEQAELGGKLLRERRARRRQARGGMAGRAAGRACPHAGGDACCRAPRPSAITTTIS